MSGESERETMTKDQLWGALEKATDQKEVAKLADHAATIGYSHDGLFLTQARKKFMELGGKNGS